MLLQEAYAIVGSVYAANADRESNDESDRDEVEVDGQLGPWSSSVDYNLLWKLKSSPDERE